MLVSGHVGRSSRPYLSRRRTIHAARGFEYLSNGVESETAVVCLFAEKRNAQKRSLMA
jgi:hypothetical protein